MHPVNLLILLSSWPDSEWKKGTNTQKKIKAAKKKRRREISFDDKKDAGKRRNVSIVGNH